MEENGSGNAAGAASDVHPIKDPDRPREKRADRPDGAGRDRERERAEEKREKAEEKRKKQRESADKELLGWIRMGLSLVTTGIGAERALTYVDRVSPMGRIDPMHLLRMLAVALMVLGLVAMVLACWRYWAVASSLRRGELAPEPRFSLSLIVAVGILTLFFLALVVVTGVRDDLVSQ